MAVRLKPEGLREIAKRDKKNGIDFDVVEVKENDSNNFLSGPLYGHSNTDEIKNIMNKNKDGKMKGMIVVATNKYGRLKHAMSFVYGKVNGKNNVLFTFKGDKSLLEKFIPEGYDIHSMGYPELNNDAHSCAIGALVNVEKMLKNSAKYAKETIANGINNNKYDYIDNKGFDHEISTYFQNSTALKNRYINKQIFEKQLLFNNKKNYQDEYFLYFDNEDVLSKNDPNNKLKGINTKLAWKGGDIVRRIMKDDDKLSTNSINTNYDVNNPHFLIDENQMTTIKKKYQTYLANRNNAKNKQSGYYEKHKYEKGNDGCCPGGCNIF